MRQNSKDVLQSFNISASNVKFGKECTNVLSVNFVFDRLIARGPLSNKL